MTKLNVTLADGRKCEMTPGQVNSPGSLTEIAERDGLAGKVKHTPEYVWNTYEVHGKDEKPPMCRRGYYITKVPGVDVAYLPITFSNKGEDQRSRAMLYAAAPDLLAAVERLLASPMLIGSSSEAVAAYRQCNAAIAKAKGERQPA